MKLSMFSIIFIPILLAISCGDENKQANIPPPEVLVYVTEASEVSIFQEFVGETLGYKDIDIRARVEGYLEGIHFEEGRKVNQGELLYTIESQQFEALVAEKMSLLAKEKVKLANALSDLNRVEPLAKENAVSQLDLDSAQARYKAAIESVKAAEADLDAAQIQLSYTKIYAPITGIIGKTKAKVGDFVGREPNPVILNTVSNTNTILVQFFITETDYLQAAKELIEHDKFMQQKKRSKTLELILSDGTVYNHTGTPDFIDRNVDPTTGAILVQASFENPDLLLRPGQFARIKAELDVKQDAILVPQRCLVELQGTFSVYVVDENNIVHNRKVVVGPTIKEFWLIKEGLGPGEKVIYEGLQKAQDGQPVKPVVKEIKLPQPGTY